MSGSPPEWRWLKVFERAIDPSVRTREIIGDQSSPRICRFCLRSAPDVTFDMDAHVVAEAFGNRSLLSAGRTWPMANPLRPSRD